ncbi:MAG: hypothetical protein AB7N65_17670 [Vicinamibacterales bacterium]
MANIAKQAGPTRHPTAAAGVPVVTMTASTPAGDLIDVSGGNVLIIVQNTDAAVAYDVTINGEAGAEGRDVTITKELTAGQIAVFGPVVGPGWMTAAGRLSVASENAAIKYGVIDLHR